MEENNIQSSPEISLVNNKPNNPNMIAGAIVIAGVIIAGAILLKGSSPSTQNNIVKNDSASGVTLAPVNNTDRTMGNPQAKVTLVLYEDFQCPFCGAVSGLQSNTDAINYLKKNIDPNWAPFMPTVNEYVKNGTLLFVYRDYAFLGPESLQSAEAARCAGDQAKFWEYHDYLYSHQNGENKGGFSDAHLKSFAVSLGLDSATFNQCLDSGKYMQAVLDSKAEGTTAGVTGTPKGFILKDGKIVATIDGAEPLSMVKPKLDAALK